MISKPNIFGYYGSYLYVRYGGVNFAKKAENETDKIIICTSRGVAAKSSFSFVIDTDGTGNADFSFNEFKYADSKSCMNITFADDETLVLSGKGNFTLDEMPSGFTDNAVELANSQGKYFIVNAYRNKTKYLVYAIKGDLKLEKNIHGDEYAQSPKGLCLKIHINGEDGYKIVVQEIPRNMRPIVLADYDYDDCKNKMLAKFEEWYSKFDTPSKEVEPIYKLAVYFNWSQTQKASGYNTRDFIKCANFLTSNWCSDIVLNGIGIMKAHPKLAFDQLAVFLDNQDEYGCIPGSMNDEQLSWNISKAPFIGAYVAEILKYYKASKEEKEYLYERIGKLVNFYFNYRDCNQDGICEYLHGNESDCDNSSCYEDFEAIDSPDLTGYLICAMDFLYDLGKELGKDDYQAWKTKADEVTKKALDYFFVNDKLCCRFPVSGEVKDSESAMPLYFLLIGKRIPQDKAEKVVEYIKKEFIGPYGIGTEGKNSSKRGTVFRGPTYFHGQLIIDGLERLGYHDLAAEAGRNYVKGIITAGTFDQFDPYTLVRTCMITTDMMVSTVAASFIYLYNKYCR